MAAPELDVLAIGDALVDVLAHVDDAELARLGLEKSSYALLEAEEAEQLYAAMPPSVEISGGAAANTAAGVDSMGGEAGYVGKVRDDQLGEVFAHDIRAIGVEYETSFAAEGPPTGRCLILVTPDAERTMRAYLGAAHGLRAVDIDQDQVARSKVIYVEGYLWLPDETGEALHRAVDVTGAAGREIAITLSDPFVVETRRKEFLDLLDGGKVDLVFGNEDEIKALYEVDDFDDAVRLVAQQCSVAALTRGAQGSVVVTADAGPVAVPAQPVERVVDTTGAGDLFAAGFLYGWTHDADPAECARLGGIAAAEVISHIGARPEVDLSTLI
jgi:sugar/nucleoside kinase (ribokinase family)